MPSRRYFPNKPLSSAHNGFTLVEVLIALVILSIFTITSFRSLNSILTAENFSNKSISAWKDVSKGFLSIENDLSNIILADEPQSFGTEYMYSLPRVYVNGGINNVTYEFSNNKLYRVTDSSSRPVIGQLDDIQFKFLSSNNEWLTAWPPSEKKNKNITTQPKALMISLNHKSLGTFERLFLIY
jgi:prepilin-type N-terminal cleavage/methylation domain-containing protein